MVNFEASRPRSFEEEAAWAWTLYNLAAPCHLGDSRLCVGTEANLSALEARGKSGRIMTNCPDCLRQEEREFGGKVSFEGQCEERRKDGRSSNASLGLGREERVKGRSG